jgi:RecB family exonuclease
MKPYDNLLTAEGRKCMSDKRAELYFSQASLSAYQTCPLRFRYRYIDQLGWLRSAKDGEYQAERQLGEQFHLIAQRYFQQVDISSLSRHISPGLLAEWFENLCNRFPLDSRTRYYPEQELRYCKDGIKLTAKYDLLAMYPDGRVVIYDWKTAAVRQTAQRVRSLQSIIYPLVLFENAFGGVRQPEQISMIFWNPRFPHEEQVWTYDVDLYHQERKKIRNLVKGIMEKPYAEFWGIKADDISPPSKDCQRCEYRGFCYSGTSPIKGGRLQPLHSLTWEDVEEISYEEA